MNYILFDGPERDGLLPFTYTRPVCDIRIGILTIREKWEKHLQTKVYAQTQDYLQKKFPTITGGELLYINGAVLPNRYLVDEIFSLEVDDILVKDGKVLAYRVGVNTDDKNTETEMPQVDSRAPLLKLNNTWDIFHHNPNAIVSDFELLTKGRKSLPLPEGVKVIGDTSDIFIEEGADINFAYLNTSSGPIYIGKDSQVMEGSKIRGPFALCEHATVKMDAKIYEGTTIGPHSKVGGEISNSVIFGYTNKGHDGFLGNSVLGEWCNLGADTNTSNLKNTYDIVKLWSIKDQTFVNTGLQFCGLIMGDHSKSGINTMFNTGTVVGVSSNIYGAGFQRNYIPSFMWGGVSGLKTYNFKKSVQVASAVMKRRNLEFDKTELGIFEHVYNLQHSK